MHRCVRACTRACVRCVDTRGPGPSRSRAELTCEIRRSSEPGLPACQGNIILGDDAYTPRGGYLASTRRLGGAGRGGRGERGETGRRLGCATRMRQKVEDIRDGERRSEGQHRRRRFNQRGLSASIFPLARFPAKSQPDSLGNSWRLCRDYAMSSRVACPRKP